MQNSLFNYNIISNINPSNNSFLTGLIAGSIGAFAVYPIDVVKTRMQNQNSQVNKLYANGFDCWKQLWKQGGLRSFYLGYLPQMLSIGPEKAIKLFAYTTVTSGNSDQLSYHILGGLVAGTSQVMITCPSDMIKINMQMNNKINYSELANIKKLYSGITACLLRDVPFSGIYFPLYWYLKEIQELNPFYAGSLAGAPAAFLCTPADVIKTRIQTQNKNLIKPSKILPTINLIIKEEGWLAFWKGAGWRVLRSSPQFGITLVIFEYLQSLPKSIK